MADKKEDVYKGNPAGDVHVISVGHAPGLTQTQVDQVVALDPPKDQVGPNMEARGVTPATQEPPPSEPVQAAVDAGQKQNEADAEQQKRSAETAAQNIQAGVNQAKDKAGKSKASGG